MIPTVVVDTTFTGKNIASAASVYEFIVPATGLYRFQIRLAAVDGGGDYVAYLTLNDGDAQGDNPMLPKTTLTAAVGETAFWFATISIDAIQGDSINVMVDGLARDTNESGSIRIFADSSLQPTVDGRKLDVAETGEAGLDFSNTVNGDFTALQKTSLNAATPSVTVSDKTGFSLATTPPTAATIASQVRSELATELSRVDATISSRLAASSYTAPANADLTTLLARLTSARAGYLDLLHTYLDAAISSRVTLGAGAIAWTYTLTDSVSGLPLADADVWVTTDLAGLNVIASGQTDQNGQITFLLDAGTVYVWRKKSGYNFTNPDTEVVS